MIKNFILILAIFFVTSEAQAMELDDAPLCTYCAYLKKNGYVQPSEKQMIQAIVGGAERNPKLESELNQLHENLLLYAREAGFYSNHLQIVHAVNLCGPSALTLQTTEDIAVNLAEHFENLGVIVQKQGSSSPQNRISRSLQERALSDVNSILVEFAKKLLVPKTNLEYAELIEFYEQKFNSWTRNSYDMGQNHRGNPSVILAENYIYSAIHTEWGQLKKAASNLENPDTISYQEKLNSAAVHMRPLFSSTTIHLLKQHLSPEIESSLERHMENALAYEIQTSQLVNLNIRMQVILGELLPAIGSFEASPHRYNRETYEVLARNFLLKLERLDAEMTNYEIGDVLNRYLPLWSQRIKGPIVFGPIAHQLFEKLSRYSGIEAYNYVFLKILSAYKSESETRSPDLEVIKAYQTMWQEMSFLESRSANNLKKPVKHFGELTYTIHAEAHVTDSLIWIDSWFRQHNIKTAYWQAEKGTPLNIARDRLRMKQIDFLNQIRTKSCQLFFTF